MCVNIQLLILFDRWVYNITPTEITIYLHIMFMQGQFANFLSVFFLIYLFSYPRDDYRCKAIGNQISSVKPNLKNMTQQSLTDLVTLNIRPTYSGTRAFLKFLVLYVNVSFKYFCWVKKVTFPNIRNCVSRYLYIYLYTQI